MGTCQDEPEQLDDWNRIAELQQRNRVCPPHLKTCYPLESRVRCEVTSRPPTLTLVSSLNIYPGFLVYWEGHSHASTWSCHSGVKSDMTVLETVSYSSGIGRHEQQEGRRFKDPALALVLALYSWDPLTVAFCPMQPTLSLATITDEEMKTGDPRETLRRASMQPTQIAEGAGITTRQQRKRVSSETHQGPGTPEVGDVCICFVLCTAPRHELALQILAVKWGGKSLFPRADVQAVGRASVRVGESMSFCHYLPNCPLPHSPRKLPAAFHAP